MSDNGVNCKTKHKLLILAYNASENCINSCYDLDSRHIWRKPEPTQATAVFVPSVSLVNN